MSYAQVVYVARNPKDAIVSFYHHHKLMKLYDYQGNLKEFAQYFMDDESMLR
jgi:estrone sulfotransferase